MSSVRQRVYREALTGAPLEAIASVLKVSRKSVALNITSLVHDGYLRRAGVEIVEGHREPPSSPGRYKGVELSLLDLWRRHLAQLESEALAVKTQIDRTRPCERGTLDALYQDGRSIALEGRALMATMGELEAGLLTEAAARTRFADRLAEVRRRDLSDRAAHEAIEVMRALGLDGEESAG